MKPVLIDNNDPKTIVLCDRYALSTLCYQIIPEQIKINFESKYPKNSYIYSIRIECYENYRNQLNDLCKDLGFVSYQDALNYTMPKTPDLNLIFDIDFDTWQQRGIKMDEEPDRFESQTDYIKQVIQNYRFVYEYTSSKRLNRDKVIQASTFGNCYMVNAKFPEQFVEIEVREAIMEQVLR